MAPKCAKEAGEAVGHSSPGLPILYTAGPYIYPYTCYYTRLHIPIPDYTILLLCQEPNHQVRKFVPEPRITVSAVSAGTLDQWLVMLAPDPVARYSPSAGCHSSTGRSAPWRRGAGY